MTHVSYLAAQRVGHNVRFGGEPQRQRVAVPARGLGYYLLGADPLERYAPYVGTCRGEIEHRLVAVGALGLLQRLAAEAHVGEESEIELRIGRDVTSHRVVPDGERRHFGRIVSPLQKANLVDRRLVGAVVVRVVKGVYAIGHGTQVLRHEYSVLLRAGYLRGLVLEHHGVVLLGRGDRIGLEEVDERAAQRIGLLALLGVARHHQRIDLVARREDVTQAVERIALVVVRHRRAEFDGIGGIGQQRIVLDLYLHRLAAQRGHGLALHGGRGVELLLQILELHVLVELDEYLVALEMSGVVGGRDSHDHGGQRVLRSARGGSDRGAAGEEGPRE